MSSISNAEWLEYESAVTLLSGGHTFTMFVRSEDNSPDRPQSPASVDSASIFLWYSHGTDDGRLIKPLTLQGESNALLQGRLYWTEATSDTEQARPEQPDTCLPLTYLNDVFAGCQTDIWPFIPASERPDASLCLSLIGVTEADESDAAEGDREAEQCELSLSGASSVRVQQFLVALSVLVNMQQKIEDILETQPQPQQQAHSLPHTPTRPQPQTQQSQLPPVHPQTPQPAAITHLSTPLTLNDSMRSDLGSARFAVLQPTDAVGFFADDAVEIASGCKSQAQSPVVARKQLTATVATPLSQPGARQMPDKPLSPQVRSRPSTTQPAHAPVYAQAAGVNIDAFISAARTGVGLEQAVAAGKEAHDRVSNGSAARRVNFDAEPVFHNEALAADTSDRKTTYDQSANASGMQSRASNVGQPSLHRKMDAPWSLHQQEENDRPEATGQLAIDETLSPRAAQRQVEFELRLYRLEQALSNERAKSAKYSTAIRVIARHQSTEQELTQRLQIAQQIIARLRLAKHDVTVKQSPVKESRKLSDIASENLRQSSPLSASQADPVPVNALDLTQERRAARRTQSTHCHARASIAHTGCSCQ